MTSIDKFWKEPDYSRFCAFGYPIVMQRNTMKAWCAYVGIPSDHPHYGFNYSDRDKNIDPHNVEINGQSPLSVFIGAFTYKDDEGVAIDLIYDCPGGITWADNRVPGHCADGYWWFGFDCSHYNDMTPHIYYLTQTGLRDAMLSDGTVYRDMEYVTYHVRKLAEQLMEVHRHA